MTSIMKWQIEGAQNQAGSNGLSANGHSVPFFAPTIRKPVPGGEQATDPISELLANRIIVFAYPFDDGVVTQIIGQLLYLDSNGEGDITMYVNSGGGSVTAGLALYDTMQQLKSDVITIGMGMCASMGAFLLSTGAPGKRLAMPGTTVMIHQPSYGMDGKVTHLRKHMEFCDDLYDRLIGTMAAHSGLEFEALEAEMLEDNYLSAEQALALGLIDKIVPAPEGKARIAPKAPKVARRAKSK